MSEERDPQVEPEASDNPVEAAERAAEQEAGEGAGGGETYANTAALEQDLADLIGGGQEEPDPAPEPEAEPATDPDAVELAGEAEPTEGPTPAEGGALGDGPAPEDNAIPLDAEETDGANPAAAPSRDADGVPVVDDVVNPAVAPATGLSDDELQRLADHLAADVESRLDGIVVEAVDHEMERVSTALKNAIHRRLKARLPDIIAEFISESRSGK
ncbi:cleavage stimulation factor subunit 3 [Thiohalospira halophila DSM 15071]|uniref:Cleavage stimulation factor subunit 3 n=1 Tax=Thiohalospira halophila DSM 15071 TaxID=1123397 RepID=A0A1I1QBF6_9GAMM|nr:hypothetical protein [Thiohalospira halophila]SFD19476.1 cleavage stimulation factor subunit 3 [Thiohalospira halophila DSM 15071]